MRRQPKQLFFIVLVAFLTFWLVIIFMAFLGPSNFLNDDTTTEYMGILYNIRTVQPNTSVSSSKEPYVISNVNYLKEVIKNRKSRTKTKSKSTSINTAADVENLAQSSINKFNLSISDMRRIIIKINSEQRVQNAERFKPQDSDMVVIVVQVHNRKTYLEYLIDSFRAADGISNALLIFSHDFFDEDINDLIDTIDFCRVMQIFYPLSMQLVPNKFPGLDPKDCPPDMPKEQALKISCQNANNPDSYGHYRSAKIAQLKHHWWWKANMVFNLKALRKYNGPVAFFEEDLYVVEDFIPTMKLMLKTANTQCRSCKIFSLATNQDAISSYKASFSRGSRATVTSQFSNMGFAFTAETWKEMQDCADVFCRFDDYNYDISIQHVFTTCMKNTAAITLAAPRVFHLGSCGTHHTTQNCESTAKIREINEQVKIQRDLLYPQKLDLEFHVDHRRSDVFYGGWGDVRDHELCLKHLLRT